MSDLALQQGLQPSICALLLAGGAGRRAGGQDKGLLQWQGKRLAEHVIARLQPQVDDVYISCNRNRVVYESLAKLTPADMRPDFQGPLAGLEAARHHLHSDYVLVAPCDTPCLPTDMGSRLIAGLHASPDCHIGYATTGGLGHYLCALIRVDCLDSLPVFLDSGQRAVRQWYQQTGAIGVAFDDRPEDFLNLNELSPQHP